MHMQQKNTYTYIYIYVCRLLKVFVFLYKIIHECTILFVCVIYITASRKSLKTYSTHNVAKLLICSQIKRLQM